MDDTVHIFPDFLERGQVGDITLEKTECCIIQMRQHVLHRPHREIVDPNHLMAARNEPIEEV
jgi:hypothetical protein